MHAPDTRFRRWLKTWFGISRSTNESDPAVTSDNQENAADVQGPVFSLGDSKQDIVVSYRAAQSDEL